jgi:hypothetical protein
MAGFVPSSESLNRSEFCGIRAYAEKLRQMMAAHDIEHSIKNNIQSSFVVIDGKTVWYASGELFGTTEDECVLRIEDEVLAGELAHNIHDFKMLCF